MTASVTLKNIYHRFDQTDVLKNVDLDIEAGEYAVLLGPSGCGKTTLLMILAGFLTPAQGQVFIGDKDITNDPPMKRATTTMFQDYALFPHMTVANNIGFGPRMRGSSRVERRATALGLLDLVGLADAIDKKPHQLSGGQRQRVALARALAVEPEVLLLDEPLGALDLKLRRQMQDELKTIQKRVGTTFIHVTHDQDEAMAIADKIIVMNQGQIEDMGTPDAVYLRPASVFSAGFMGEINFLSGCLEKFTDQQYIVSTHLGGLTLPKTAVINKILKPNDPVKICIRPEHFRIERSNTSLDFGLAKINDIAFFGTHQRCHLSPIADPKITLIAHLPQSAKIKSGAEIPMYLIPEAIVILPG